jgi:hypothetical protein
VGLSDSTALVTRIAFDAVSIAEFIGQLLAETKWHWPHPVTELPAVYLEIGKDFQTDKIPLDNAQAIR